MIEENQNQLSNRSLTLSGGIQTPLFLNTPTFSSVKLYQNAILHIHIFIHNDESLLAGKGGQYKSLRFDADAVAVALVVAAEPHI